MSKIKVENIVKTFNRHSRNANKVLKGVSFELPEKGLTCIFGKSGSGKTTLLNIIGGLEKADSGKVYIDGECTSGKTDKIRNAKIGFIFQNYYLEKGYTIAEILRNQMIIAGFKDEKEIARRTEEALKLVDMERFKNKLGDALSGGQQQRVAIARAIVKGSDVILADEPTGNLDAENTMKVMDILKEISKTQLVVIVTHEVSLIKKYADSHIKIVDGELVEDGEIEETDLAPATYDNIKEGNETHSVLTTFTKSTAKRNGRLFTLKTIFKRNNAGGERQRISIARAFLKDAPVILLDEATASLDVENETMIQSALSRLIKDKTVLVIAHRMRTVAGADKIVVLADGVVAEQGKPSELYNKNGIYARMVDLQSASGKWKIK